MPLQSFSITTRTFQRSQVSGSPELLQVRLRLRLTVSSTEEQEYLNVDPPKTGGEGGSSSSGQSWSC